MTHSLPNGFLDWLNLVEKRHLADLRLSEVTKALRALSAIYVERRRTSVTGSAGPKTRSALDSAGKRAAFALFYGPLHFLTIHAIVRALGAADPPPVSIVDIGCGTGVAGAAWAIAAGGVPVAGFDRDRWAVEEARWTYRSLGLAGRSVPGDVLRPASIRPGSAIVAAYVLNELADDRRDDLERRLVDAPARGIRTLVVEPIAKSVTPWWEASARRVEQAGGRADEWRLAIDLPPLLQLLDKASGLDHRVLTARSLYCPQAPLRARGA